MARTQSSFVGRDYPHEGRAAKVREAQLLETAVEAYRFFYPTVSMEGVFDGIREAGVADGKGFIVLSARPRHSILTADADLPQALGVIDLDRMGPVVIDMPAGPFGGVVDDHHQRWVVDLGLIGPDGGKGGRYFVVPWDHDGSVPKDAFVARSATNKALVALRAVPVNIGVSRALEALQTVKVYALATPDQPMTFVDVSHRDLDATALRWEGGLEFWRRLAAIIEEEPVPLELRPAHGQLAALGIGRGRRFPTDPHVLRILEHASANALEQMRVAAFASASPSRLVWPDRHWEWVALRDDADFEADGYLDLEARERWFIQAIGASPAMFRRREGKGAIHFLAARDARGAYLDGGLAYRLDVPLPVPAGLFWSVTAYDAHTRTQVRTAQEKAVLGSLDEAIGTASGASIALHFGPTRPRAEAARWIQTTPGAGFFLYFRIYRPGRASLDGSWRLGDLVRVAEAPRTRLSGWLARGRRPASRDAC